MHNQLSKLTTYALLFALTNIAQAQNRTLDQVLDIFWNANSTKITEQATASILESPTTFEEVANNLARGRHYPPDSPTGKLRMTRLNNDDTEHPFFIIVPDNYDPQLAYQVRVYLHGGVSRNNWDKSNTNWWRQTDDLERDDVISIFPAGWKDSIWWQQSQSENLKGIIDWTKRNYNVNENQVHLFGVSDGASGAYYQAMRAPMPWASILPFIGHPGVSTAPDRSDGGFHLGNFTNRPFFIVNGGRDPLYPVSTIEVWIEEFKKAGVDLVFTPKPRAGHETSWWQEESENIERFINEHPRDPLPNKISWQTEWVDRSERYHWLQVLELGNLDGDITFPPSNMILETPTEFFSRIDLETRGNLIFSYSQGIKRFKLLISTSQFDLSRPIKVFNNNRLVFDQILTPNISTLLKWAAEDNDRTMLFAAEIEIDLSSFE